MNKAKTYGLVFLSLSLLLSLPFVFSWIQNDDLYGHSLNQEAKPFELKDTAGQPHSLAQHRGNYVFLYFGYLNCDEVCHNQVGVMFNIHHQTAEQDIDFIFVTMDPQRDSDEMLNAYFNQFGSNFYALRSDSIKQVQSIATLYNAAFFPDRNIATAEDYEMEHPGTLFLIDPAGQLRVMYPNMHLRYDYIIEDLQQLRKLNTTH